MYETVVSFGTALIEGLSSLRPTKSTKKKIGKSLGLMYRELYDVVQNGNKIVKIFEGKRLRRITNYIELHHLLFEQSIRLKNINEIAKSSKIDKVLNIYLPKIQEMKLLIESKSARVSLLEGQIKKHKLGYGHEVALDFPIPYYHEKFVPPSKPRIQAAKETLKKLEFISSDLREFIVSHFDVDEIL